MRAVDLVVANVEEFYRPVTSPLGEAARQGWSRACSEVSGGAFFWGEGDRVLLTGAPLDSSLVREVDERLGSGRTLPLAPEEPVAELSSWLRNALEKGADFWEGLGVDPPARVLAWGQSPELNGLLTRMALSGENFRADYGGEESLWLVAQADSKCGLRGLLADFGGEGAVMAEGFVAQNLIEAADLCEVVLGRWGGCLVKADRSTAGWGIVQFDAATHRRFSILRHLRRVARGVPELLSFPLVVERPVRSRAGEVSSCSAQGFADGRGGAALRFCARHLGSTGAGMIGSGVLDRRVEERLGVAFHSVARRLSALGFRGVLGVDFALDQESRPVLLEVNPRRTTLTAAYDAASRLDLPGEGGEWCAVFDPAVKGPAAWDELPAAARSLLWGEGGAGGCRGWLPVPAPRAYQGAPSWVGALIFAPDAEAAVALRGELTGLRAERGVAT